MKYFDLVEINEYVGLGDYVTKNNIQRFEVVDITDDYELEEETRAYYECELYTPEDDYHHYLVCKDIYGSAVNYEDVEEWLIN